jgi:hypothetical protein
MLLDFGLGALIGAFGGRSAPCGYCSVPCWLQRWTHVAERFGFLPVGDAFAVTLSGGVTTSASDASAAISSR